MCIVHTAHGKHGTNNCHREQQQRRRASAREIQRNGREREINAKPLIQLQR